MGISNIIFLLIVLFGSFLFTFNVRKVIRNINLGRDIKINDRKGERWKTMFMVAIGQSKMVVRPVAGILHIFVYVGFIIINVEVIEIIIDGIFGTHRFLASILGPLYDILIGSFELLAFAVMIVCAIFLIRRNIIRLKRFISKDLNGWPRSDANIILITEIFLMSAFLKMNAADYLLQGKGLEHYIHAGAFPISSMLLVPLMHGYSTEFLIFVERFCWWFHIIGIMFFLNYVPYSKHFHILLAFPNVWYSNLNAKGRFNNMQSVTNEVKLMLDPSAVPPPADPNAVPGKFGAKDVTDLTWKNLMDAYSCTECGRCTSVCPANLTGKLLSPRKIMMSTRDRLEEVGKNLDKNGKDFVDDKSLLNDYITTEELWACTTCNACVDACPVNIDPLNIIIELRRYLVMEQSAAPSELNGMFTNIENNQAPWQFSPADRLNWAKE
ncbi:MAG: (Fe-S)-binding protein [Bacteroidota bacterium]